MFWKKEPPIKAILDKLQKRDLERQKIVEPFRQQVLDIQKVVEVLHQAIYVPTKVNREYMRQTRLFKKTARTQAEKHWQLLEEIQEWIKQIPERDKERQEAAKKLVKIGWFFDPDMAWYTPHEIACAIDEGRIGEVETALSEYFQRQLDAIEQRLKAACPHRENILCDAFDAHGEKKYNLSVPVFLTQADGMWWDKFSKSFFMRGGRESAAAKFMLQAKEEFFKSLMSLFEASAPLWQSKPERNLSFNELNRHQVLHGEVVGYGTEINSLKIISFLNYLCWVLKEVDSE